VENQLQVFDVFRLALLVGTVRLGIHFMFITNMMTYSVPCKFNAHMHKLRIVCKHSLYILQKMALEKRSLESLLVLHGFGQSNKRCQMYNQHLFGRLSLKYELRFAEGKFPATGFREEECSWWRTDDVLADLVERRDVVSDELVMSIPPADIIMGFSQGGNLALHCLERRPESFGLGVICCGLQGTAFRKQTPGDPVVQHVPLTRPVVLVFGEKDPFITTQHREDLIRMAPNAPVIMHKGGHNIPQSAAFVGQLYEAIAKAKQSF